MLIQLLRLSTSNARCVGSVPGVETMTLHAMWSSQKVLKKKKEEEEEEEELSGLHLNIF